ncbi:AI-2E family transporter, partial [Roseicyclus sp.]|uniref:AI-2E family transporter n=1 Tax=Roseicyclus sp. TaxID=1914329 RepID=UPI003F9F7B40
DRIGRYLFVKTAINIILGAISFAIMLLLGIEFALFWAVLIAFLNYIPYIGSIVGVIFPVLLSLAQFGTIAMAGTVLVALSAAQIFVGAWLEPRMMGRAFNLSPFVVLLSLAVWSTLWGLPGALLAVPMTASLVLVLAEIRSTRFIAVMLSASGRV